MDSAVGMQGGAIANLSLGINNDIGVNRHTVTHLNLLPYFKYYFLLTIILTCET